jgi:hypothetical protein
MQEHLAAMLPTLAGNRECRTVGKTSKCLQVHVSIVRILPWRQFSHGILESCVAFMTGSLLPVVSTVVLRAITYVPVGVLLATLRSVLALSANILHQAP